ncbi:MAG: hypothetical protein HQK79_15170 [Desulfobacterales bacterium]|nr:hypothetical protein [Desulfobacterales bacterium]
MRLKSINETNVKIDLMADAKAYFMYAFNMRYNSVYSYEIKSLENINNKVLPDALRPPGYPLFLYSLVSNPPNEKMIYNIQFAQVIISTLTILFSFLFFIEIIPLFWAAIGVFFVAINPHLIVMNSYILTETLFCFLIVIIGFLISIFFKKPNFFMSTLIGFVIGIASIVRNSLQYFPIIMLFLLLFQYGKRKGFLFSITLILGFSLVFLPWIIRNLTTLNIVTDKTLIINFLHHGSYPDFKYKNIPETFGFPYKYDPNSKEISQSIKSVLKEITSCFYNEPIKYIAWYIFKKPISFWSWNIVQGMGDIFVYPVLKSPYFESLFFKLTHKFMYGTHFFLVISCFIGCFIIWFLPLKINVPTNSIFILRFVSIFLLYFTLLHMIGAPFPRYSIPLRPYMYIMALFSLSIINIKSNDKTINSYTLLQ